MIELTNTPCFIDRQACLKSLLSNELNIAMGLPHIDDAIMHSFIRNAMAKAARHSNMSLGQQVNNEFRVWYDGEWNIVKETVDQIGD